MNSINVIIFMLIILFIILFIYSFFFVNSDIIKYRVIKEKI